VWLLVVSTVPKKENLNMDWDTHDALTVTSWVCWSCASFNLLVHRSSSLLLACIVTKEFRISLFPQVCMYNKIVRGPAHFWCTIQSILSTTRKTLFSFEHVTISRGQVADLTATCQWSRFIHMRAHFVQCQRRGQVTSRYACIFGWRFMRGRFPVVALGDDTSDRDALQ
jgi:hypothetical protein